MVATPTTMATARPASTAVRPGPAVRTVLTVPQPYSPPKSSAPNTSARAPANTGNPPSAFATSWSGSTLARIASFDAPSRGPEESDLNDR